MPQPPDHRDPRGDPPLLRVRGLAKTYEQRNGLSTTRVRALDDVDFEVAHGEVVALVGESGSGKSTAARLLARLEAASAGEVELLGKPVPVLTKTHASLAYGSQVQMIFQDPFASLNPVHKIGYHLQRPLIRHGKQRAGTDALQARVSELLESVGLRPGPDFMARYPHQLSGGQRQRVAIARTLAVEPRLIIADEPTSMLDVSIRIEILNLLRQFKRERGISFIYITHDLATARYFADRIIVLYAGRVVESAPVDALLSRPVHPYTKLLLSAVPDPHGSVATPLASEGKSHIKPAQAGCAFAPRCRDADHTCTSQLPKIRTVAPLHTARCHLYGKPEPRRRD